MQIKSYKTHLSKGVYPAYSFAPREEYMESMVNILPTNRGGVFFNRRNIFAKGYTNASADDRAPQVLLGRDYNIAGYTSSIRTLNLTATWTDSAIASVYNLTDFTVGSVLGAASGAFTTGKVWHFADMGGAIFATNGTSLAFRHHGQGVWFSTTAQRCNSVCRYKNRLVYAGLKNTGYDFFSAAYKAKIASFGSDFTYTSEVGKNWLIIGSVDKEEIYDYFFEWLITASRLKKQEFTGDIHYVVMDWPDNIVKVEQLGESLIVYGENNISAVTLKDGIPSQKLICGFGLGAGSARGHTVQAKNGHYFVNGAFEVCFIDENLSVKKTGHIITAGEYILSYSYTFDNLYIASTRSATTYVLSPFGLGNQWQVVFSIAKYTGTTASEVIIPSVLVSGDASLSTPVDSLNEVSRKHFTEIRLITDGGIALTSYEVKFYFRDNVASSFTDTGWLSPTPDGIVTMQESGVDCQIAIRAVSPSGAFEIHDIQLLWDVAEKGRL